MTQILMICEEQLFADSVFCALTCSDLPDEINFVHLSSRRQISLNVNIQTVDIIIYVSSGLRQEDISLISKIRKNNPNLRQLNIISDLDTVVRTDERIKYMHRNNRFEVLREIVCEFMKMEGKISSMKTPTAVAKTGRNNQVRAIEQNLSRLKKLDEFYLKNDREGFTLLYRDILDVAFNQADYFDFSYDLIRRSVALYLNTFRVKHALDLGGIDNEFLSVLDNPRPSHKQMLRVFFRLCDIIFTQNEIENDVEIIKKAKDYIDKKFKSDLTLLAVAQAVGSNPSYLSRLFTQTQGQTMSEYIARLKTNEAKRLLKNTSLTVSKISSRLGFRSANYFIRFFKKHVGVPPLVWRESN